MRALEGKRPFWHDIDAFAGSGKSLVLKTIIHACRALGKIVLVVAFQGNIAAMYDDGSTIHNLLQIKFDELSFESSPLPDRISTSVDKGSMRAALLRAADLLVLDEITDITNSLFDHTDRTFKHVRESGELFGGLSSVSAGDWRQLLPIPNFNTTDSDGAPQHLPPSSLKSETLRNCLKSNPLYISGVTRTFHLRRNFRITDSAYASFVLDIAKDSCSHVNISYDDVSLPRPVVPLRDIRTFFSISEYVLQFLPRFIIVPHNFFF